MVESFLTNHNLSILKPGKFPPIKINHATLPLAQTKQKPIGGIPIYSTYIYFQLEPTANKFILQLSRDDIQTVETNVNSQCGYFECAESASSRSVYGPMMSPMGGPEQWKPDESIRVSCST